MRWRIFQILAGRATGRMWKPEYMGTRYLQSVVDRAAIIQAPNEYGNVVVGIPAGVAASTGPK